VYDAVMVVLVEWQRECAEQGREFLHV